MASRFHLLPLTFITALFVACGPAAMAPPPATEMAMMAPTASATAVPSPTSTATAAATPTPLPLPTFTAMPPPTSIPIPSATPTLMPTATAVPTLVNGLVLDDFLILDDATRQNVRAIYQRGQTLGRNAHAFSKLGDSGAFTGHYLTRFDYPPHYTLGDYAYLQPTIDWFKNSFERYGVAVVNGMSSWHVLDPAWTNQTWCAADEHLLACEIRLHNPSILLLRLGTNDASSAAVLERNLRRIVAFVMDQGVIPVLATKADRFEEEFDQNNEAIRRVAVEMHIPLWDFDRVAATLPDYGLLPDRVHLTHADRNDYTDPVTFHKGYPMNDLTGLLVLHHLRILVAVPASGTANAGPALTP